MQLVKDKEFGGERPLFASHDLHLDHVTILEGESGIKECCNIIATNCRFEGNYLAWMDCSCLGITSEHLEKELLSKAKLWINAGTMYGPEGEGFMRWNLACPRINVEEGLRRFHSYLCIR